MKIALIANPMSGGGRGKKRIPRIEKFLREQNIDYDLFTTKYHRHSMEIVKSINPDDYDAIAPMGGDGTNYQVLNAVIKYHSTEKRKPLALIPAGRGNSFARDLNFQKPEDGVLALLHNQPKPIDVLSYTDGGEKHYFVNMTGFGFITDVDATALNYKVFGEFSYVIGVLVRTIGLKFHQIELKFDDKIISGPNTFVEFCNSKMTAGSMMMAPDAEIDDGLMDIVVAGPLSRLELLQTFPKIFSGKHGENPAIKFYRTKNASITTKPDKLLLPDGEHHGSTPTEIEMHHHLVKYFM